MTIDINGELQERHDRLSCMYYGRLTFKVPERGLSKTYTVAASTFVDNTMLKLNVEQGGVSVLTTEDLAHPSPFQEIMFAILGTLLQAILFGKPEKTHAIALQVVPRYPKVFEDFCAGLAGPTVH